MSFSVNFCAIFALILVTGLLLAVDSLGGINAGSASLSLAAQNGDALSASDSCVPVVPAVLFPVSATDPTETPIEITVNDSGFSLNELDMAQSSMRTIKITNMGADSHSFVIDKLGIDSGAILSGQTKTVVLENLMPDLQSVDFYSGIVGDRADKFRGTIIIN